MRIAIQAVGYLVLFALLYCWFGIADRNAWQLLLSLVLGAVIVFAAVWLVAGALAAEVISPRRLGGFAVWVLAILAVILCGIWLAGYRGSVGFSVASHLTQWFRKPVKPQTMGAIYAWLVRIGGAAAVLALLPRAVKARPTGRYWLTAAGLTLAGILLPILLVSWVPDLKGFGAQTASMIVRFILAYAIALAAWLSIAAAARRSSLEGKGRIGPAAFR